MKNFINRIFRFLNGLKRPSKRSNLRKLEKKGETMDSFVIREARAEDIPELATLHVKTWADTYWFVKNPPTYAIREWQWKEQFKETADQWFCYVIFNSRHQMIGFVRGRTRQHERYSEFTGELNKIYLLTEYQRLGLGSRMMGLAARRFLTMGIDKMILFGAAENPSCAFHEKLGGEKLFDEKGIFHGAYCWRDVRRLVEL